MLHSQRVAVEQLHLEFLAAQHLRALKHGSCSCFGLAQFSWCLGFAEDFSIFKVQLKESGNLPTTFTFMYLYVAPVLPLDLALICWLVLHVQRAPRPTVSFPWHQPSRKRGNHTVMAPVLLVLSTHKPPLIECIIPLKKKQLKLIPSGKLRLPWKITMFICKSTMNGPFSGAIQRVHQWIIPLNYH